MKKLLMLLLLPCCATAQHIDLAVQGGVSVNNGPWKYADGGAGYAFSVKPALHIRKLMLGLGVDAHRTVALSRVNQTDQNGQALPRRMSYGNPQLAYYAFANYKFPIPAGYFYTGISAGYSAFAFNDRVFTPVSVRMSGPMAGMQAGIQCNVTRHIGIGGEVAPRFYAMQAGARPAGASVPESASVFACPAMVGMRVRLL